MAEANEEKHFSENMENILGQLEDVVDSWDEYEKIEGYISCINGFLMMFSFEPLYPPFPLDRFVLYGACGGGDRNTGAVMGWKNREFK